MDNLPDEIWTVLFRPPPAWPWTIEPEFNPGSLGKSVLDRDFPSAARSAFAFLENVGFELTVPDAWDISASAVTIMWERPDALLLSTLTDDGSFFVLIGPRADDIPGTPIRERLIGFVRDHGTVVGFGSFPLVGSSPAETATAVSSYALAFRGGAEKLLADRPIDYLALSAALERVIEDLRQRRLVVYHRESAEAAWAATRYDTFLDHAAALDRLKSPLESPERISIAEARRKAPLTLGREDLDEETRIRRAVDLVQKSAQRVDATSRRRFFSFGARVEWEEAAHDWHQAMSLLYPAQFWDNIDRLHRGERDAIDPAIVFLEIDPWAFRTGYAKETILRYLTRVELNEEQSERMRRVILSAVDVGDRREFRGHCRLARRVVNDQFVAALLGRLRAADEGSARRSLWVLYALRTQLAPDDRAVAQRILEVCAEDREWWRVSSWVWAYTARYADQGWLSHLLQVALNAGPSKSAALRLLGRTSITLTAGQPEALAELVLRQIETGDDESWLETTAVLADSPPFREKLIEVYRASSERDVRRRAWWAINAIRRAARDGWPAEGFDS